MSRYSRLRVDANDIEFYEVPDHFLQEKRPSEALDGAAEAERAQQKAIRDHIYCVPSTEILSDSKLQHTKGYTHCVLQHTPSQQRQQQNIENGNPNVCAPVRGPTTRTTVSAICSHSSTTSAASLQEQAGGGARVGSSVSGRWTGKSIEDRSSRWKAAECELSFRGEVDAGSALAASGDAVEPPPGGQWATSVKRVTSYREAATLQEKASETCPSAAAIKTGQSQTQGNQSCTLHSSCNEVRQSQRFTKNPSFRETNSGTAPIIGVPEKKSLAAVMQSSSDGEYGGSFSQERSAAALQRSYSTRELKPRPEVTIDNWRDQPATRSAREPFNCVDGRHRVSFALVENQQKQREKFREPIPEKKKVLSARGNHPDRDQSLRYNYEQPGFVEQKKDDSGKAYTIYGVTGSKECPTKSYSRPQKLLRAFSQREQQRSDYARISRTFSVNGSGRNVLPVECVTCGEGLGIVVLGFPGNEASFCQSCKPSARGTGWYCPRDSSSKSSKKKKGIIDYCRKLFGLPKKVG